MVDDDDLIATLLNFLCVSITQILTGKIFEYIKEENSSNIFIIESLLVFLESLHMIFSIDITNPNKRREDIFKESIAFLFQSIFIGPIISLFGFLFFNRFSSVLILKLNTCSLILSLFNVLITLLTYLLIEYSLIGSTSLPIFSCIIEICSIFISYVFLQMELSVPLNLFLMVILLASYSSLYCFYRAPYNIPFLSIILVYCGSLLSSLIIERSAVHSIISDLLLFSGIGTTVIYLFITKLIHTNIDQFYRILFLSNLTIIFYSFYLSGLYGALYFLLYNGVLIFVYQLYNRIYRVEYRYYKDMYRGLISAIFEMVLIETGGVYIVYLSKMAISKN